MTVYLRESQNKEGLIRCLNKASWGEDCRQNTVTDNSDPIFLPGYRHPYLWFLVDNSGHLVLGIPDLDEKGRVDIVASCDAKIRKQLINVVANVFGASMFSTKTIQ